MNRIPKPNQSSIEPVEEVTPGFDADELLSKCGVILQREIRNLLIASTGRKLDRGESQDLVAYIKLLSEIKVEQQEEVSNFTNEELIKVSKNTL